MTDEEAKKMIEGMSEWDARNLLNKKGYGPASIKMLLKAEKEVSKPSPKLAPKAAPIDKAEVRDTKTETPVQQTSKRKSTTESKK